jgi:hypothetical protein
MKKLIIAVGILLGLSAQSFAFDGPYFRGIWESTYTSHPIVTMGTLMTTKGAYDGVTTQVALVWHKGDKYNTIIPQALQDMGVQPMSWTLLNAGAGYGNGTGNMLCGSSVNVGPSLLGPVGQLLKQSNNIVAQTAGNFLQGTSAGGVALGYVWNANPIKDGALMPFNQWGSHLDAFLGAEWKF